MTSRLTGAVFWSGLEAAAAGLLSFVSAFVVARVIGPNELGVGAAAVSVHVLLWVVVNALFADAIVQRGTLDETALASAFWASTVVGIAAAFVQLLSGKLLLVMLGDARLPGMAAVLALSLPLVGAAGAMQGVLTRERNYRGLAGRTLIGQGIGTATGIAAALAGAGAWSLVLQQAVGSGAGAAVLLARARWRLRCRPRWRPVREMLALGAPLTFATLVQLGRYRVFALLVGATAGAASLGQVHMAFRLVDTVRELIFTALWRLMLPVMATRQHDLHGLREMVDRCLGLASVIVLPLLGGMAVSIAPLVTVLLGPAWRPVAGAAAPLIGLAAWLFLWFPPGCALVARGKPGPALKANVAAMLATLAGVALLRPETPRQAIAVWLAGQLLTSPYTVMQIAHVLGTSWWRPIRAGMPALSATAAAVCAALLLPAMLGVSSGGLCLLVARLAAGVPCCLVGMAICLHRLGPMPVMRWSRKSVAQPLGAAEGR
jgi:O-antigen/teichoic acid export membrane protein